MSADLGATMQSLYAQFGDLPGVTIELHKELLAVRVENTAATATIFLQGAQLSHYQRHGEPAIIWCSPQCDYTQGTPLRGGIPICWPWFGALDKNPAAVQQHIGIDSEQASAHGLIRNQLWQLDAVEALGDDQTRLQLSLTLQQDQLTAWKTATTLTLELLVGNDLNMNLNVTNRSDQTVCFSTALHSYFAVSNINDVTLDGLSGLEYIDCLQDWSEQTQQGALLIDREVDRIYHGTNEVITLVDSGWQRAIDVQSKGSNSAIIWNPWIEKSRRLSHFADDGYQHMLCIETANADRDTVQLGPGQLHQLALTIRCRQLS